MLGKATFNARTKKPEVFKTKNYGQPPRIAQTGLRPLHSGRINEEGHNAA